MQAVELHPWRVLRSVVLELLSYDVPKVIDRAGLQVDWTLTKEQNFSDKMRIAAYRPRIDAAYAELSKDASLRLAYVVTGELVQRGHGEKLERALHAIGWRLESGKLIPDSDPVRELFFPTQRQHDAYTEIRSILQTAKKSIDLVDPYVDQSVLTLVGSAAKPSMIVSILTTEIPRDMPVEMKKWRAQYSDTTLEVRKTREFHDRFVVIDSESCWHIGCSIKDAGGKAFMLSRMEDEVNRDALLKQIGASWAIGSEVS